MRIDPRQRSSDLEDRRGGGGGGGFGGGGGGFGRGRLGLGGLVILLVLSVVFKRDFLSLAGGGDGAAVEAPAGEAPVQDPSEEPAVLRLSAVLDSTQNFWARTLPSMGTPYQRARLVLFRDATQTACGYGQAATGPFYCPGDQRVYLDLAFLDELANRFGAPGDFAQAYVLAHEIGHHVQNLLGTSDEVHRAQQGGDQERANQLSVRLELQADCYAGVWGNTAARQQLLDPGDVEEGLGAAAAVGDDRLQRQATGRVNPESWTHGSSEQRMQWFQRGFRDGRPEACDTFSR
ncbi:MAG: zinc metallopeptidase [Gemmatimonadaceae bacterium]|nr:zinc metallopeptidase [Gemmatimonadaceae bacterium]